MKNYKSGETAPKAGTYKVMNDKSGKQLNSVHLKAGDTFPPTSQANCHYEC